METMIDRSRLKPLICCLISGVYINVLAINDSDAADFDPHNLQLQLEQQQKQITELQKQLNALPEKPDDTGVDHPGNTLDIAGFFDFTAHAEKNADSTFSLGGLELDLQYDKVDNFAVSAALVWSEDAAEVAVAVVDYHIYDHDVPTRGRIFNEPGFHLQLGRFDIPFGVDYEYFAAPDRPNVTAPLTTQHILNDGLNGDGVRLYGSWSRFEYALYWTNSVFEDAGSSIGTRIGFLPGKNPYRIHYTESQRDFIIGLSWLRDMDSDENERQTLSAVDLSWTIGFTQLIFEYIKLDTDEVIVLPDTTSAGPATEEGYNIRWIMDFDPTLFYVGYGEWRPDYAATLDPEDDTVSYEVDNLERLTVGSRYVIDDYVQLKLEYFTHLDSASAESGVAKRRLTFQLVASF